MSTTKSDEAVYPPVVMEALDRLLDGLPTSERIPVEDEVMAALHQFARDNSAENLQVIAGKWPELAVALSALGPVSEAVA